MLQVSYSWDTAYALSDNTETDGHDSSLVVEDGSTLMITTLVVVDDLLAGDNNKDVLL